jgi:hypothetical protein
MAYSIDRYNRTLLTTVQDGTIDQTTDLKLVGKNYAGYGEIQNENFVYLLENFAGPSQPPKAISGQIWFDSSASKLKFYDGTKFRTTGGAEISATAPSGLTEGDFWWDTSNEQLYAYNGADFVLVGPQDAGEGVTQMQSRTVRDTQGTNRSVIVSVINDTVVHVISNEAFTIDNTDAENLIPGFDVIKKGLTMVNTLASTGGVTGTEHVYWGTASNALKLGGKDASLYVTSSPGEATIFSELVEFSDDGFTVGDSNDLRVYIDNDNEAFISNEVGRKILFSAKDVLGSLKNSLIVESNALLPGLQGDGTTTETVTLGSATRLFSNVYATQFTGLSEKASTLVVGGSNRAGDTAATANTVAVRDASADIRANLFRGTALTAKYADLAEKYTTDEEYPVGTAMAIGGDAEARAAKASDVAIGVISDEPAIKMNSEAEGQYIGLKGRVPVRVKGPVSKGMPVYAWQDGVCTTIATSSIVGVALESSDSEEEKLIECVLKV